MKQVVTVFEFSIFEFKPQRVKQAHFNDSRFFFFFKKKSLTEKDNVVRVNLQQASNHPDLLL